MKAIFLTNFFSMIYNHCCIILDKNQGLANQDFISYNEQYEDRN